MNFEFAKTVQSEAFVARSPKFIPTFERLMTVANKCFGREMKPKNRLEDICFSLGNACRDDFLEVVFLATNGYGFAASKILRGLYERGVTIAYLIKQPEKAERFVKFAAIQEHRALEAALKVVSEDEFDKAFGTINNAAQIRQNYNQFKGEFQTTLCKKCKTTRTQSTWDLDIAAMVHALGNPYDTLYLGGYTIPNFHVHATLASAYSALNEQSRTKKVEAEGDYALLIATTTLLLVIQSQNKLFSLNLELEIAACENDVVDLWNSPGN